MTDGSSLAHAAPDPNSDDATPEAEAEADAGASADGGGGADAQNDGTDSADGAADGDRSIDAAPTLVPTRTRAMNRDVAAQVTAAAARGAGQDRRVILRFNLGFGIDGGDPSGAPLLSGSTLSSADYSRLRMYGFGDAIVGTRGLGVGSLNTYFASQFRFDNDLRASSPVPTAHDADGMLASQTRMAYAETDGFFETPVLAPLFLRAGRQYVYGPFIAHFDGLTIGYETPALRLQIFGGARSPLYAANYRDLDGNSVGHAFSGVRGRMTGVSARFNLWELRRVPLVLEGDSFSYEDTDNFQAGVSLNWSDDLQLRAHFRILNNGFANQGLSARARLSKVTVLTGELNYRGTEDWVYDLLVDAPPADGTDARRYLDLGPPLPRVVLGVRAGTVLLDNVDVLLRAAAAADLSNDMRERQSSFSAGYAEAGAAVEVRLRRAIGLGASVLARRVRRPDLVVADTAAMADPLPAELSSAGERSFWEMGSSLRYNAGARRFGATAEAYLRLYRWNEVYDVSLDKLGFETRGGGRFSVEAWTASQLRIKAEYDLSTAIESAPELRGIKTLRVVAEGTY